MTMKTEIRKIERALRGLDKDQGRIARRNARVSAFGAIKALENAIDREYPLIEKARKPLDMSLEAKAERYTLSAFYSEIKALMPEEWDQLHAQLLVDTIADAVGLSTGPIVQRPGGTFGWQDDGVFHAELRERFDASVKWGGLISTLAWYVARDDGGGRQSMKATDRRRCRGLLRVWRTYEQLQVSGQFAQLSAEAADA